MGCAEASHRAAATEHSSDSVVVRAVLDLSNRPHFECDLPFDEEYVGDLPSGIMSASESGAGTGCWLETCTTATGSSDSPGTSAEPAFELEPETEDSAPWDFLCGNILSCEMLFHVLNSLTLETRASCHLELR